MVSVEEEQYFKEALNDKEKELIAPFFSSTESNVFVLTNLPEVIKGTLFSRYSRSDKGARRLLLDEFMPNKDVAEVIGSKSASEHASTVLAINRAEDFYQRILVGYGDDSVAELAGVHIACENISSIAADMLTDSRAGISPLEKSARYIPFDRKVNGRYLWYRDSKILNSRYADLYSDTMDRLFSSYSEWLPIVKEHVKAAVPRDPAATERAYDNAIRAKACDILKNILPGGRLTNVGLYGNGRAFEYLLTKLYSSGIDEAKSLASRMHAELSKVIPSFVKRASESEFLSSMRNAASEHAKRAVTKAEIPDDPAYLRLISYDSEGETEAIAAMLYPYSNLPLEEIRSMVKKSTEDEKRGILNACLSKRRNRRDKPGRAFENPYYTFEICANYGMFRDLHRHRVMTQERQHLTTDLGFDIPPELKEIGLEPDYVELMQSARAANLKMREEMPNEAQYLVPRAFRMRWYMRMNLREAYHLTELRSMKQGHPDYRKVAQQMKSLIAEKHPLLAEYMQVDMNDYALPRIESEKRIDQKLADLDSKKDG